MSRFIIIGLILLSLHAHAEGERIVTNDGDTIHCLAIEETFIHEDSLSFTLITGERAYVANPLLRVKEFTSNGRRFINLRPYGFYEVFYTGSLTYLKKEEVLYLGDRFEKKAFRSALLTPGLSLNRLSVLKDSEALISFNGDTLIDLSFRDWKSYIHFYCELLLIEPPRFSPDQLAAVVEYINRETDDSHLGDIYINWLDEPVNVLSIQPEVRDGELIQVIYNDLELNEHKHKGRKKCFVFKSISTHGQTVAFISEDILNTKRHEHYWLVHESDNVALLRTELLRDAVDPQTEIGYTYITRKFIVRLDDSFYYFDDFELPEDFIAHLKRSNSILSVDADRLSPKSPYQLEELVRLYDQK